MWGVMGGVVALAAVAGLALWLRGRRIVATKMRAMELSEDDQALLSDANACILADPGAAAASKRATGFLVLTRRELLFVPRGGAPALHIPRSSILAVERQPPRLEVRYSRSAAGSEAPAPEVVSWELLHAEGWYRGLTAGPGVMRTATSLPDGERA